MSRSPPFISMHFEQNVGLSRKRLLKSIEHLWTNTLLERIVGLSFECKFCIHVKNDLRLFNKSLFSLALLMWVVHMCACGWHIRILQVCTYCFTFFLSSHPSQHNASCLSFRGWTESNWDYCAQWYYVCNLKIA